MDTYRLTINNNDLSTVSTTQETSVCGFTVVKAPGGPRTPVRISAGDSAKIKDIFGVASKEYPDLYEATTFNSSYDLYISAPYTEAKVGGLLFTVDGIKEFLVGEGDSAKPGYFNYGAIEDYVLESNSEEFEGSFSSLIHSDDSSEASETYNIITTTQDLGKINEGSFDSGSSGTEGLIYNTNLSLEALKDKLEIANAQHNSYKIAIEGLEDSISYVYTNFEKESLSSSSSESSIYLYNLEHLVGASHRVGTADISDSNNVKLIFTGFEGDGEFPTKTAVTKAIELIKDSTISNNLRVLSTKTFKISSEETKENFDEYVKAIIIPKYPSNRNLTIKVGGFNSNKGYKKNDVNSRNILKITAYEEGAFHDESYPVSFTGSLNLSATDASGKYIGFTSSNSDYAEQDLVYVLVGSTITQEDVKSNPNPVGYGSQFILSNGSHETDITDASNKDVYETGWDYAKNEEYSTVDIFFESRALDSNSSNPNSNSFFSLSGIHPLSGYIFNLTPSTVAEVTSPLSYGERYWNICNKAIVTLSTKERIISSLTGARAAMQCRIIENRYGGIAPMYLNSGTPSMGGQLSVSGIYKMVNKYTSQEQQTLDENNYNPIIQDHSYGVMCVGQKTCKEGETTDWSYIGHVCSFLAFQREVREQVMIPQLGKANNPYYRQLRAEQVTQLLSKRLEGNNRIWAEATVDTSTATGCNDAAAQRAKKFVINVKVKPDIYSEYVELNFTNYSE